MKMELVNLKVSEYQYQRVLTTQQLASSYETETKNISKNFTRNQERYFEGKHYFVVKYGENGYRQFADNKSIRRPIYLWTEKGCFLHAKSLNTDVAWNVYEMLIENYFTSKPQINQLTNELNQIKNQLKLLTDNKQKYQAKYKDYITITELLKKYAINISAADANQILWEEDVLEKIYLNCTDGKTIKGYKISKFWQVYGRNFQYPRSPEGLTQPKWKTSKSHLIAQIIRDCIY